MKPTKTENRYCKCRFMSLRHTRQADGGLLCPNCGSVKYPVVFIRAMIAKEHQRVEVSGS